MKRSVRTSARRLGTAGALATLVVALVAAPVLGASRPDAAGAAAVAYPEAPRHGVCADEWRAVRANPAVETLKALGLCEVDRRLATIDRLRNVTTDARALTDEHQAALERILDHSASGLRELRAEIEGDTELAELREDLPRIAEDFRIYVLVVRQVRLVVAADITELAVERASSAADRLEGAIEAAEAAGKDVGDAPELLASMRDHIAAADAAIDGIADAVLPLTPSDWNDGAAEPVLDDARNAIAEARREHLRAAIAAARAIIAELR
jgi:hypothetical protein